MFYITKTLPYYILSIFSGLLILLSNLSVPHYYYVAVLLVLISPIIIYITPQMIRQLDSLEWTLIAALCVYACVSAINMWFHGNWYWAEFNEPSKFLLVVFVFLAVRRHGLEERVLAISCVVGVASAFALAWYQAEVLNIGRVYGSTNRIISAFGLIVLLSGYFALIYIAFNENLKKWRFLLALIVSALLLYAVALTGTKGVWIGLPGALSLLLIAKWNSSKWLILVLAVITCAVLVIFFMFNDLVHHRLTGLRQPLITYFESGVVSDGSLTIRLEVWKAAVIMFFNNPVFGVGLGGFLSVKAELIAAGVIQPATGFVGGPHNDILGVLAIQGMVGFSALLFMYYAFLRLCWCYKAQSVELFWCSLGLIVIYSLTGLAGDRLSSNLTATYLALMMAIFVGQMSYKQKLFLMSSKVKN
jgi:O-antigen ligase